MVCHHSIPDYSLTPFNGAYFGLVNQGVHTGTFSATDAAGNTGTCTVVISVTDNEPPVFINCPSADILATTGPTDCEANVQWPLVFADDNCSFTLTSTHLSGDLFTGGITPVTFTATDAGGNSTDCTFNVNVQDETAPIAMCMDLTVSLDANGEYALDGSGIG